MGDDEEQRLVWKLKVSARVRRFNLKLHLQNRLSSWKLHRLSFLLRFRKHHLKIASYSKPVCVAKPKSRSRFRFRFLRREAESQADSRKKLLVWNQSLGNKAILGVATLIIILCFLLGWICVAHL